MTQPNYLLTLDQSTTLEIAGGKGLNLARLIQAGMPVPLGFTITTAAYDAFIQYNQLAGHLTAALTSLKQGGQLAEISGQIRAFFAKGDFPPELADKIKYAYRELCQQAGQNNLPVAVRSSATTEDLPEASFAGQQDTFLNVRGEIPILDAVRRCFSSLWNEHAIVYRARQGFAQLSAKLAVVVQQMVFADAAGVLFTANPLTKDPTQIVIDAVWGLGESLVSGKLTPDHIVVNKHSKTVSSYIVAEKATMIIASRDSIVEQPVPVFKRRIRVLKNKQIRKLIGLAQSITEFAGSPQDIEWCLAKEKFYLIQARPITTLPENPVFWEAPGPGKWVHGGGTYEMLSEPVSPLFATLLVPAFAEAMLRMMAEVGLKSVFPEEPYKVVNGFLYQHLGFRLRPWHLGGLIKFMIMLPSMIKRQEAEQVQYRETIANLTQPVTPFTAEKLLQRMQALGTVGMRYWQQAMNISMMSYRQEQKFGRFYWCLHRLGDPEPEIFLCGQKIQSWKAECSVFELAMLARKLGLDNIIKTIPWPNQVAQVGMEEWRKALEAHLEIFGHQLFSVDLALPTLADDPRPVLSAIQAFLHGKESPYERQKRMALACDQAIHAMESRLSLHGRKKFRQLLNSAREASRVREDTFFDLGLAWTYMHRYAKELGTRLTDRGIIPQTKDIFWLRLDEIRAVCSDSSAISNFSRQIAERRAHNKLWSKLEAPLLIPVDSRPGFLLGRTKFAELHHHPDKHTLVGLGVSPGKVTAVARIINSMDEVQRLNAGEILVTRSTTPAWTPIFTHIAGLITDMGGPLSHGSIVAREVGIPAVMGTGNATRKIRDGQIVTILGCEGKVLLHNN